MSSDKITLPNGDTIEFLSHGEFLVVHEKTDKECLFAETLVDAYAFASCDWSIRKNKTTDVYLGFFEDIGRYTWDAAHNITPSELTTFASYERAQEFLKRSEFYNEGHIVAAPKVSY